MVSEVVNCPKSRQSKTGRNFNFATDLKLILQQTEVLQYVWAAYRLVSYQFCSCLDRLLPFRSKIKITGTRRVSTVWRYHTHKWSTYSTWQRSELQGGASEERNILPSTEVINETCIVSRLITDIVRNRERLSDQGKSGRVYMQKAWGRWEMLTYLGRSVKQTNSVTGWWCYRAL